ncbi:MAG: hypothetical protein MRERC_7c068 [Mycoplasmataceae bacterium RC_NB112A]|nr:MAG: hypothetical protein MRERC_8c067 [Mycoplasmataceae bacterium RC_NB112A]KLL01903.1 MAG: hypothetical protein MRERC_7c068 [Mycoplasmataceae bacterium RC_NB112A]
MRSLSLGRQEYLYEKIRPLLPEKYSNNLPLQNLQC